jgi:proteasome lid subunit RPN8/RPN11
VVIPAEVRAALAAHAESEAPNEACGLVLLRDGIAERYAPGRNGAASPYRFELEFDDPEIWFAEDGRREHRALGGKALPHPHGEDGRSGRLPDRRRPDRGDRA